MIIYIKLKNSGSFSGSISVLCSDIILKWHYIRTIGADIIKLYAIDIGTPFVNIELISSL